MAAAAAISASLVSAALSCVSGKGLGAPGSGRPVSRGSPVGVMVTPRRSRTVAAYSSASSRRTGAGPGLTHTTCSGSAAAPGPASGRSGVVDGVALTQRLLVASQR
jgi:hypothetical protein